MKRVISILFVLASLASPFALSAQKYENGLIDKTVAIIGNEAIFLSQVESEMKTSVYYGMSVNRCQLLEMMLEQKLFLAQARLDSLPVNHEQVEMELNRWLSDAIMNFGSEQALSDYFGKPMYKITQEKRTAISEALLVQDMKNKISGKVGSLSPSDVKRFYQRTSKDSLPEIPTQYQIRQIVIYPQKENAVLDVKSRLLEFRNRVMNGEKFSTLATLYSEDRASAVRGGELKMASRQSFWSEFSDAAMALNPGQVSQIVETPDGFHIIQMIEKNGDMFNARHILLRPVFSETDKMTAYNRLDSLKMQIDSGKISFESAAMIYSEDTQSRVNGGLVADDRTGSAYFEKDMLKPEDYRIISTMQPGDISAPFESRDNKGRNGNLVYKIIKLEKIVPAHSPNMEQDYNILLDEATKRASEDLINKFIDDKIQTTYIRIDDMFAGCRFSRQGWVK